MYVRSSDVPRSSKAREGLLPLLEVLLTELSKAVDFKGLPPAGVAFPVRVEKLNPKSEVAPGITLKPNTCPQTDVSLRISWGNGAMVTLRIGMGELLLPIIIGSTSAHSVKTPTMTPIAICFVSASFMTPILGPLPLLSPSTTSAFGSIRLVLT
jgi:hypothetical protein